MARRATPPEPPRVPEAALPGTQDPVAKRPRTTGKKPVAREKPATTRNRPAGQSPVDSDVRPARAQPAKRAKTPTRRPAASPIDETPAPQAESALAIPDAGPASGAGTPLAIALLGSADAVRAAFAIEDPITAIHKLRRALKQARALLALIGGRQRPAARRLSRRLSEAARSLAATRDRHIIHDALADIAAHADPGGLDEAFARELAQTLAPRGDGSDGGEAGLAALREAGLAEEIAGAALLAEGTGADALPEALAASYRRARSAARGVDTDDADALHDVRKRVVAHCCQMELAAPWWPRLCAVWQDELQRLRDALGRHHDLEILLDRLDEASAQLPAEQVAIAMQAASHRQRKLAGKALRHHARLFAERPKAFRRRLATYLDAHLEHARDQG